MFFYFFLQYHLFNHKLYYFSTIFKIFKYSFIIIFEISIYQHTFYIKPVSFITSFANIILESTDSLLSKHLLGCCIVTFSALFLEFLQLQ